LPASRRRYTTIDEYTASFPENIRSKLKELRRVIRQSAPQSEETITYGIPTFRFKGNLVHFAAFKDHISFFPTPSAIEAFKEELRQYKQSTGTIQFPLDKPIPFDLIKRIVKFRVDQNQSRKD
jgi:uncharacterized protein YdhG (YjbR/CyaY superfamily)